MKLHERLGGERERGWLRVLKVWILSHRVAVLASPKETPAVVRTESHSKSFKAWQMSGLGPEAGSSG